MRIRARILKLAYPLVRVVWAVWNPYMRTIRVVVRHGDDVLLIRHTYGTQAWGVPGGGMKKDEDPVEAAIRETREETGLEIADATLIPGNPFTQVPHDRGELWVVAGTAATREYQIDGVEIAEAQWFATDSLPDDMLQQGNAALAAAGITQR